MRIFVLAASGLLLILANPFGVSADPRAPSTQLAKPKPGTAVQAGRRARAVEAVSDDVLKSKLNSSTIGLAAGQLEGAPLRFATELAARHHRHHAHVLAV